MTLDEFRSSLDAATPPAGGVLEGLWLDARGDWHAAHRVAQSLSDAGGAWLHAYLHRKEGDAANAGYWYRRAGRTPPACTLEEEWRALAEAFTTG